MPLPTPALQAAVQRHIRKYDGELARAAKALTISRETLARVAAGLTVRVGTIDQLTARLPKPTNEKGA